MTRMENVMFSDEMSRNRMQWQTEESAEKKVSQGFAAEKVKHRHVEGQSQKKIDHF